MYTAITKFSLRPGLTREQAIEEIKETIPVYQHQPAFVRKYICLDMDKREGRGIYLWTDRTAAEAFFARARDMIRKQTGSEPEIVILDTPVIVDKASGEVIID